jgi:RNA polymerase sigma factor (sigma-70 family)
VANRAEQRERSTVGVIPKHFEIITIAVVSALRAHVTGPAGGNLRGRGSWLLRIVANETHNLHRASGRRMARERRAWEQSQPLLLARPDDPAEALLSLERQSALVQGLARLSPEHRQVVTCRYLLDLDEAETAAVLGWPRGTVKSRLRRALIKLEDVLDTEASRDRTREVKQGG